VYKKVLCFFCKIQTLLKNKQKISINETLPVCINLLRPLPSFVACEFLDDNSSPALNNKVINAFSYLLKSHEMCISQMMLQRPEYVVIGRRNGWVIRRMRPNERSSHPNAKIWYWVVFATCGRTLSWSKITTWSTSLASKWHLFF